MIKGACNKNKRPTFQGLGNCFIKRKSPTCRIFVLPYVRVWMGFAWSVHWPVNKTWIRKTHEIQSWFVDYIFTVTRDPLTFWSVNRDFCRLKRCKCRDEGSKWKIVELRFYSNKIHCQELCSGQTKSRESPVWSAPYFLFPSHHRVI